ncbi:MAG: YcgN family cysteine cluster protein [Gammaproteobacteria bacterium]|nr:YcgN family cysteine cluster protein [Gammaproteobacteria bacterium]
MNFWETKTLAAMTDAEWESLCDGCGRCCLIKLEDEDTGELHYTSVVCLYFNQRTARCKRYPERHELVPECIHFDASGAAAFDWLPDSCAYRKLAHGEPLEWWHPLVSGDRRTVIEAGISVLGKVTSEVHVHEDDLEDHIVRWVEGGRRV